MKARWPVYLLIGVTAFSLALLWSLPSPPRGESRPLPEAPAAPPAAASLPLPPPGPEPFAASQPLAEPPAPAPLASTRETGGAGLPPLDAAPGLPAMSRQELLAILATQYVYVGFTEFNGNRRGTLMRRGNRERLGVEEHADIDGMTVRSLDADCCVLGQEQYTYTLYLVDLDYIDKLKNQLPLPVPGAEDQAKRQRYYDEMFARPERVRNTRVGEVPYPTRPLSPEAVEEGKRAFVDQSLGPKLDRLRQDRQSGKDPHAQMALDPRERKPWDPLAGPPEHPSQMRPLTPDEYRQAFRTYWDRTWPGRTPQPGVGEPPPPPADLSDIVIERRGGTR